MSSSGDGACDPVRPWVQPARQSKATMKASHRFSLSHLRGYSSGALARGSCPVFPMLRSRNSVGVSPVTLRKTRLK